jgi:L-methionine (R)-S-oxide reductase
MSKAPKLRPDLPVWYDPLSPMGAAVRYVAGLSPLFNWVGIYVLKGDILELGPFIGADTPHKKIRVGQGVCGTAVATGADQNVADVELVVLIHDRSGKILGQIDIDSHTLNAFSPELEEAVRQVANDLGELWPAQEKSRRR